MPKKWKNINFDDTHDALDIVFNTFTMDYYFWKWKGLQKKLFA